MAAVLEFTATSDDARLMDAATDALAQALGLRVERRELPAMPSKVGAAAAFVLSTIDDPSVQLVTLPYAGGRGDGVVMDVIQHCAKPVVVVPIGPGSTPMRSIGRILIPLNGSPESAETVAELAALFAASGADIVVLHVFDSTTVPKFWDQAVHAQKSWTEEFLLRNCDQVNVRMELRAGSAGENILDVATSEHADLIALGWAQRLSPGRARIVRMTIAEAAIPVLLLPVAGSDGAMKLFPDAKGASRP
jgi:nucleotide-binding universal stress UspA family protein